MRPGPFTRWPRAADAALAAVLFALAVSIREGPGDALRWRAAVDVPIWALLLVAVASAALYWRRRAPAAVLAVVLAAWALLLGSDFSVVGGQALFAVYALGRYGTADRWGHVGVDAALVVLVLDGITADEPWGGVAFGVVVFVAVWDVGRRLRTRAQRAAARVRELQEREQRIVADERARIARELHDVVAHRVSLMTVQAGAAKTVASSDPEAAARAMGAVEEAGRQALDELRHLLGVLRPSAGSADTEPQPGLADLPALVARMREAGLDVDLRIDGVTRGLPARVELSAYRIVQESLTNVVKHAGPGARTDVRLTTEGRDLVVEVRDDGSGATSLPGAGHGIVGMRERAQLLGGALDVGPRPDGGFAARARLPLDGGAS
ncbi:Two component integral membrane sensor signal transduction histidine kinase [Modestobacter italicus]|uniref:histidine kinase n=1 Tax=Modestobacter italicus (strain DSM 44449 / CECT 9708 / BC 501) TaxID=2732864 RepID=I4EX58_MODI5|nr:sensor histidine kinase [Modestobacter marinus]CCH87971.1 Two component integral membrane sensor signal transduction histidine kinase [Modestobacter marinus]